MILTLVILAEEVFQLAFGLQLHDQLAKQSIRPSEPRAGVIGRIVLMERLVHEARASFSSLEVVARMIKLIGQI